MQLNAEELAKQDQDCGVTPSTERKTVSFTGLGEKPASWAWVRSQTNQVRVGMSRGTAWGRSFQVEACVDS